MNIKDNVAIKIYNYNPFTVSVTSQTMTHVLSPCYDLDVPTFDTVTFSELNYVNSVSACIRTGLIELDKEYAKELYSALNISNPDGIITNLAIKDTILNPTKDKLAKIIDAIDDSIFVRINAIYRELINSGEYDISNRVSNVIETRLDEIRRGILSSKISLSTKDDKLVSEDINDVKKQNESLQEQLNQMQEMMAKLLASQKESVTTEVKKKPGRSPQNSKK